jgi:hypothetical protein
MNMSHSLIIFHQLLGFSASNELRLNNPNNLHYSSILTVGAMQNNRGQYPITNQNNIMITSVKSRKLRNFLKNVSQSDLLIGFVMKMNRKMIQNF